MKNFLKPIAQIVAEIKPEGEMSIGSKRFKYKYTKIYIHGVGKIYNVTYHEDSVDFYYWEFTMELNDGIRINCITNRKNKMDEDYLYFEKGEWIEFFGCVNTFERGLFCRYNVSNILLDDAKLSDEKIAFSDVIMWDAKIYQGIATTRHEEGWIERQIACISELLEEVPEKKWIYGHLIKKGKDVVLQLDKVIQ